jgi:(1->4)-alpha-D-glucan 1-alpha-D-glucosylmutase
MTLRPLTATYRFQFTREFTFEDARKLVPYLRDLGISHLYASPIFHARAGSTHGYDVIDHDAFNPELGGEAGFHALVDDLHRAGMGVIVDIVPNHAGIGGMTNTRWLDVLEFGRRSRNARFFDIDWNAGPLVLPILEAPLDEVIAGGKLTLAADGKSGRFYLALGDQKLPLRPRTVARLLTDVAEALDRPEIADAAQAWSELKGQRAAAAGRTMRREAIGAVLDDPAVGEALERSLRGADVAAIAAEQHYKLMFWREGAAAINYRRFFDITDLAGLRVEEPAVFDAVHRLPIALVREGRLDGIRVDHIDGLADPAAYCARLRERVGPDISIHVEKILGLGEALRDWPIDGTTGYETLNLINGLFVDPAGYGAFTEHLARSGMDGTSEARTQGAKREVLERSFTAELNGLARLGADVSRRFGHPVRLGTMREIVRELIVAMPVYRTYIAEQAEPEDRAILERAAAEARGLLSRGAKRALLTLVGLLERGAEDKELATFIRRFQQLSGPAMAKGYEDTELYRYIGLSSVNEVGSHLERPSVSIEAFHAACLDVARRGWRSLTPLSTHDTKRGADTRARINVLSEMSGAWLAACDRWHDRHRDLRRRGNDPAEVPDRVDEDLVYQTLLGVWPVSRERIEGYLLKAMREAKRRTTWIDRNDSYERGVVQFASALVEEEAGADFRHELEAMLATVGPAGRRNGLSQTVLQLTVPGVPDIYRGSEFFEHVLVDPDNRRPVDWDARREGLRHGFQGALEDDAAGLSKQRIIARVLALRQEQSTLFERGRYEPLPTAGAPGVIAFARRHEERLVVVVAATRALSQGRGDVVVDLGAGERMRWRPVVNGADVRQEGRLLRIDQAALPAVMVGSRLP